LETIYRLLENSTSEQSKKPKPKIEHKKVSTMNPDLRNRKGKKPAANATSKFKKRR
jgi:hypothetical protein